MLKKAPIQQSLGRMEQLYQKHLRDYRAKYFAKLAIIEASGWIEESMDDIIRQCATKHLNDPKNTAFVDKLIKNTHSFNYGNFRHMLIQLLGIVNVEKLEHAYNQNKFTHMTSSLSILKQRRDDLAHTYIKGTTQTIDAPSVTRNHFRSTCDGLKNIELCIRKLKL